MAVTARAAAAPRDVPRTARELDDIQRVISPAFDPRFYRAVYTDLPPDVGPLWHYRMQGWRERRDPAPWFSTHQYLVDNPDVLKMDVEPFFHFLTRGRHEGRDIAPSIHAAAYLDQVGWVPETWSYQAFAVGPTPSGRQSASLETPAAPELSPAEARIVMSGEFDSGFYRAMNPDVAASGMDPLDHFIRTGWTEDRDPNAGFSVRDYLETYPEVAASGLNPFAHFLAIGRAAGRLGRQPLGFRYQIIARQKPMERRIADAVASSAVLPVEDAAALSQGLSQARTSLKDLHITFSHDNYAESSGGLQMCVRRESERFAAMGVDHLHLFPANPWPAVRVAGEPGPLGVLLNGRRVGIFTPLAVRDALAQSAPTKAGRRTFAIHSLLGHEPDETADILAAAGLREGFFWLHDFASLCAGFHLQRNDLEDCAAPPPDSTACSVCTYGPFRARHTRAHQRLFERLSLTVVAPSQTTLDFWLARGDLPAGPTRVLPHARLTAGKALAKPAVERPFRLAYLGMPSALKGWPIFRELAERLADDPRYQFLHLGGRADPSTRMAFHPVVVTGDKPRAMQEAVEALDVDAAMIWPLCRETFSFTAYEAAAAGAAVITGPDSGNVAAFAAERGRGAVLADETALFEAFASGEILSLGRARRAARRYDLAYSGMTGDLVKA